MATGMFGGSKLGTILGKRKNIFFTFLGQKDDGKN